MDEAPKKTATLERRLKICESCGGQFECCPGGCWCDEVELSQASRDALRARYQDCLCPACLQVHSHGLQPQLRPTHPAP